MIYDEDYPSSHASQMLFAPLIDLEGLTYQVDAPIKYRVGPKAGEDTPRRYRKLRRSEIIFREFSGVRFGPVLIALGPAPQGCPLDRCVHLIGKSF